MQTIRTDIAVVGLGAMGSATLYQLARRGTDVVGIDRFLPPHDRGSSHGETRITRQAVGEGAAYAPFVLASQRIWRELEEASGHELFNPCGGLIIAPRDANASHHGKADFFATTMATAERFGIAHQLLERDEVMSRFPQFAGMTEDQSAYYEPGAGYLHPERCIDVQLGQAHHHGARILTGSAVKAIENSAYGVRLTLGDSCIDARQVVVAAGAWSGELLGAPFAHLLTVRRQVLHWFALEPHAHFPHPSPVHIWMHGSGDSDYFYGFPPLPGAHDIKVATEQYHSAIHAEALERQVTPHESEMMFERHLRGRMAGVTSRVVDAKACLYTVTPDHGFICDTHPEMPGVFVVSACSGHGFKHSAAIGQAVAERLLAQPSDFDLSPFALSRFRV